MNEQIKRLADEILNFATCGPNGSGIDPRPDVDADDIKAALKLAIKQVNQIQHTIQQQAAAAERAWAASDAAVEIAREEQKRAAAVEFSPLPEVDANGYPEPFRAFIR